MKIKILHNLFIRHNEIKQSNQSIWLLHGFGDSGLAYKEIFESNLASKFNIYIVDLPGFGVSPIHSEFLSINKQADLVASIIRQETEEQSKVNIVAHSLGGLIGTWICQKLNEKINYYINIEGNLTEADSYFSSKPLKYESAKQFAEVFKDEVFEIAKTQERYKRYYSSLRFASPEGMRNWSVTSQAFIKDNKCGFEFNDLTCKKIYVWGDIDTPKETQEFIKLHKIPNRLYHGIGHWHMVENSTILYNDINEIIKKA